MEYNYIKALHLIFVITWFAGLFYIPRLFIYHIEATQKDSHQAAVLVPQLKLMSRRLWTIICWPSAILPRALPFGFWCSTPVYSCAVDAYQARICGIAIGLSPHHSSDVSRTPTRSNSVYFQHNASVE